jgi:polyisoprenoid-binding protein YceI
MIAKGHASWVLACGLSLLGSYAAEPLPHRVEKATVAVVCSLTIGGSFEAKTTSLAGELALDPETADGVRGTLSADLRTLETGIALRDRHLRQNYLEVDKGPAFASATLDHIKIDNWNGTGKFQGVLALHGVQRAIAGTATVTRDRQGYQVAATFPLKISDFQIPEPVYLGVGVRDTIEVRVKVSAVPASPSK